MPRGDHNDPHMLDGLERWTGVRLVDSVPQAPPEPPGEAEPRGRRKPEREGRGERQPAAGRALGTPPPEPEPPPASWPTMAPEAFHGPAGDFVRLAEPHTEADRVALLVQLLVAFGNVAGRGPHFKVEASRHGANLFAVFVGETAKARKGTSAAHVLGLVESLEPDWRKRRVVEGLVSGEGLIWNLRDPQPDKGDPGEADKRLLVVEQEFAGTLRILARQGNILSPILRRAWDGEDLRTLAKNSPAVATEPHVSIVGHVTGAELCRGLSDSEAGNGFGNRFLWCLVRRSKCLPEGGAFEGENLRPIVNRLARALKFSRGVGELVKSEAARRVWEQVYPELSEGKSGLLGSLIARAEAQALRLALVYAMLDSSPVIDEPHLLAALAVWDYCEQSARYIFGDSLGDPVADEILRFLRQEPNGATRTEIRDHFGRHRGRQVIGRALDLLQAQGLAACERGGTRGRPVEGWRAI